MRCSITGSGAARLPGGRIAVFAEATEFLVATASGLAVLLFPDGTLPSPPLARRYSWASWALPRIYLAHLLADQARAAGLRSLRVGPAGNPLTGAPLAAPALGPGAAGPARPGSWLAHPGLLAALPGPPGRQLPARLR